MDVMDGCRYFIKVPFSTYDKEKRLNEFWCCFFEAKKVLDNATDKQTSQRN